MQWEYSQLRFKTPHPWAQTQKQQITGPDEPKVNDAHSLLLKM